MNNTLLTCIIILYVLPVVVNLGYAIWTAMKFKFDGSIVVVSFIPVLNLISAIVVIGGSIMIWATFEAYIKDRR